MKKMYICSDTFDGIFSALHDAWKECRHSDAEIVMYGMLQQKFFCEYTAVDETREKTVKVVRLIRKYLGTEAYAQICYALLSNEEDKGTSVFHVIQKARNIFDSKKIMSHLTDSDVSRVFTLSRKVSNESHLYEEFIRFMEVGDGILFSEITPESQILTCIADHFENRLPMENWMIYDKTHKSVLIHEKQNKSIIVRLNAEEQLSDITVSDGEKKYNRLWEIFFKSIAIKERTNKKCQMSHMPLKYRREFI